MSATRGRLEVCVVGIVAFALSSASFGVVSFDAQDRLTAPPKKAGGDKSDAKSKAKPDGKEKSEVKAPALNFKMKDIDGKEQDLHDYYGNVILMVNTASKCGFTPQYGGLEELYQKYKEQHFVVLAFPANNFGNQEPGDNKEIKKYCETTYAITFPLFGKVSVKGADICDLYKYLTRKEEGYEFGGEIPWNFNKFLISRTGVVIGRFKHTDAPVKSKKLTEAIEKALAEPIPADSPLAAPPPMRPKSSAVTS